MNSVYLCLFDVHRNKTLFKEDTNMRRIFASLMVAVMLVMCIQPCFAAIDSVTEIPDGPTKPITINVKARKANEGTFVAPLLLNDISSATGVDYEFGLDLSSIQDYIDGPAIDSAFKESAEFRNGLVEADFSIKVSYPASATVTGNLLTDGTLENSNDIFEEVSPRTEGTDGDKKTITVKYKNKEELKVGELIDNLSTLAGLKFTLNDAIAYTAGTHKIEVELLDTSNIKFKYTTPVAYTATLNLVGNAEHITTATAPYTGGGGGSSSTVTVKFNANGGTVVESVKIKRGTTVAEPTTTREGYKFEGWYTDSKLTNKFDFSTAVKTSITLYAKWVEDPDAVIDSICGKFVDVDIDEWYHEGVHYAIENGIMNGTGAATFDPAVNVSRAMLVTVLWRAENKPAATEESAFVDLKSGEYYVDAVKWANENGVVTGTTETTFAPDNAITREQFAAIMYRYANLKGYDVSVGENTNILSYTDYSKISEYAIPALQYTVGSGLIKGKTESTLNPTDRATRAEMATILYRFFTANK